MGTYSLPKVEAVSPWSDYSTGTKEGGVLNLLELESMSVQSRMHSLHHSSAWSAEQCGIGHSTFWTELQPLQPHVDWSQESIALDADLQGSENRG